MTLEASILPLAAKISSAVVYPILTVACGAIASTVAHAIPWPLAADKAEAYTRWEATANATMDSALGRHGTIGTFGARQHPLSWFREQVLRLRLGLYPTDTFQYTSTTLYQVSYHIKYLFF